MPTETPPSEPTPQPVMGVARPASVPPSHPRRPTEDRWENEGGEVIPRAVASIVPPLTGKLPQDTVAGCRLRAEGDLVRAGESDTDHGRRKFEHSADAWNLRDMLENLAGRRLRKASAPTRP